MPKISINDLNNVEMLKNLIDKMNLGDVMIIWITYIHTYIFLAKLFMYVELFYTLKIHKYKKSK
jgi:hypothetical protein